MNATIAGKDSALLDKLLPADRMRLDFHTGTVKFDAGQVIYDPGDTVEYCYFPVGAAVASYFVELECGSVVETVLVGREGAIGGIVSNGMLPSYARAVVLHGGTFKRVPVRELEEMKRSIPAVAHLFNRYADCLMAQVFQSIACNAVHTIEQRAAKWLTAAVDRIGRSEVMMTQEQLASMMGVGRSYASRVLQRFKRDGILRTRRGGIEVLDGEALRKRGCACNEQVASHYNRVLGGIYPRED